MGKRFKLIACEVLYREVCFAVAHSKNIIDIEFLTQGLHDIEAAEMCGRIQEIADRADPAKYSAILLGYGLCNNGIVGLTARKLKIVAPRAHDCITFFLGSKERYRQYFDQNPGTYYKTTGWIERDQVNIESMPTTKMGKLMLDKTYQEYAELYGEDNACYIMEILGAGVKNYDRYAYIDLGLAKELKYDQATAKEAADNGWRYERLAGELRLIHNLVNGQWDEKDFLIVNPCHKIEATNKENIIRAIQIAATEPQQRDYTC